MRVGERQGFIITEGLKESCASKAGALIEGNILRIIHKNMTMRVGRIAGIDERMFLWIFVGEW